MIKKIYAICALLFVAGIATAQKNLAIVQGKLENENARMAVFSKPVNGDPVDVATMYLQPGNTFSFALPNLEEGFYYISDERRRIFTRIYLKPNDRLDIILGSKEELTLVSGSPENATLVKWDGIKYNFWRCSNILTLGLTTYKEFFPMLEEILKQQPIFLKSIKTPNAKFNEMMKLAVQHDIEYTALQFLMLPNAIHPTKEELPAWYAATLKTPKFTDARVLQFAEAKRYLAVYPSLYYIQTLHKDSISAKFKSFGKSIPGMELVVNDTMKGVLAVSHISRYRSYDDLLETMKPYEQYLLNDSLKAAYTRVVTTLGGLKRGSAAYDFSYKDINDNEVKLSSMKGKVLVLDMWATWCKPCIGEIPHMKKLEEEMHGSDVLFVSISVDKEKDKEKWKEFVAKEQLSGLQLFASGGDDIMRFYQINAIPRFIVVDAQGKIVTVDAPRPSEPELKKLLEETLKNKQS